MMKKRMPCLMLAVLLCVGFCASAAAQGSYGQINQELTRPQLWERIVVESDFTFEEQLQNSNAENLAFSVIPYGSYPSIDGSTVTVPMAIEFARQHLSLEEIDIESFVFFNTTHEAYVNLIEKKPNPAPQVVSANGVMDPAHPVDLILVTPPSDEETKLANQQGVALTMEAVCYDAFVFIVHKDNPIESLSLAQIQAIYSGEITNYAEVGGSDAPIAAYQRPKNSGSQTAMENLVMQGKPLKESPHEYSFIGMGSLVEAVADFQMRESSLGYTYLYYIDTLYKNENLKVIKVDGIEPSPENLRSGAYPLTTAYYGVIRKEDAENAGGLFLEWILSKEGQRCIAQAGYVTAIPLE